MIPELNVFGPPGHMDQKPLTAARGQTAPVAAILKSTETDVNEEIRIARAFLSNPPLECGKGVWYRPVYRFRSRVQPALANTECGASSALAFDSSLRLSAGVYLFTGREN
jgi:hypothetical protein